MSTADRLRCRYEGPSLGTLATKWATEPQWTCTHGAHPFACLSECVLCPDWIKPAGKQFPEPHPGPWSGTPAESRHPRGVITDRWDRDAGLADLYYGADVFCVLGGPSCKSLPLADLGRRGAAIFSVNNCPAILPAPLRPHIWTHTDPCGKFHDSIWRDPAILKLSPRNEWASSHGHRNRGLFERVEGDEFRHVPEISARDMPGTLGYARNTAFDPDAWLWEASINRGNDRQHAEGEPSRGLKANGWPHVINTMFTALRLCFFLGFRRVFLVGCDFKMAADQPYGFEQAKSSGGVSNNNQSYRNMNRMFMALAPKFHAEGFEVYNTNPESGLRAFPYLSFAEAVQAATGDFEQGLNTAGWYRSGVDEKVPGDE